MDILDEIRSHAQVSTDAQRTLLCEPERVEAIATAVERLGLAHRLTVKASPTVPAGRILVLDERALEAAMNQTFQRAAKRIRLLPGG